MASAYNIPWRNCTFVALDIETSGAYPIGDEIVEIALVKWQDGKIIDTFESLFKPSRRMNPEVIAIHGITNEMVENSPTITSKLAQIREFIGDSVIMAHHAPFDMGFISWEFEKNKMSLPHQAGVCTSLLSRALITDSANHKLQTLISHLGISQGKAHRALDDTLACLQVGMICFEKLSTHATIKDIHSVQKKKIFWSDYSILDLKSNASLNQAIQACIEGKDLDFSYLSHNAKTAKTRRGRPMGIVRSPDGDFMMAHCYIDQKPKRFYLNKIVEAQMCLF